MYSVLRSLISFQEAPCYGLVCYVWSITTNWRGKCVTSIWLTIHISTGSYQYMSSLCDHKIHLLRFIFFYCTLVYNKYVILLCSICNHHKTLLTSQILNQFLSYIFKHNFLMQTSKSTTSQKLWLPTHSKHWNTEPYWGSADCGEGDCESYFNHMVSVFHSKYNNVTNQC